MCRGQLISALLYADDAVIFAEDEELMRRGLDVLAEWCEEWSVKVNVEKCGMMHLRRKGVKRSDERFHVGGEGIKVMEEYKYLGCVVVEYLSNVRMVEERAKVGAKALSDWLRRYRATVGEVKGATFVRLLEMLVESVLLYGVEAWGRGGQLDAVKNVQMRAARIFLGVGRHHPLVSLQFEMDMLPVKLDNECKARCVGMDCKRRRRRMAKLRGGTAELGIEIGRWHGLRREDKVCKECGNGEAEDTEHFVMRCAYVVEERKRLENLMSSRVKRWYELGDNEKVVRIMDRACCDEAVARAVESIWKKFFCCRCSHSSPDLIATFTVKFCYI